MSILQSMLLQIHQNVQAHTTNILFRQKTCQRLEFQERPTQHSFCRATKTPFSQEIVYSLPSSMPLHRFHSAVCFDAMQSNVSPSGKFTTLLPCRKIGILVSLYLLAKTLIYIYTLLITDYSLQFRWLFQQVERSRSQKTTNERADNVHPHIS